MGKLDIKPSLAALLESSSAAVLNIAAIQVLRSRSSVLVFIIIKMPSLYYLTMALAATTSVIASPVQIEKRGFSINQVAHGTFRKNGELTDLWSIYARYLLIWFCYLQVRSR